MHHSHCQKIWEAWREEEKELEKEQAIYKRVYQRLERNIMSLRTIYNYY